MNREESNQEALQDPLLPPVPSGPCRTANDEEGRLPQQPRTTSTALPATPQPHHESRNIPIMLWFQFLRCAPEAVWLSSVLSAYVYLLRPDNPELVGFLSAVEGITQLVAACLAGILEDLYRRDVLLKITSFLGMSASALVILATTQHIFVCLPVALALNGAFDGIGLTASFAIFADSIPDGKRSHYFTQRELSTTLGQFVGPLFGLIMFVVLGDHWSIQSCAQVMITAQVLLVPSFILLWYFQDVENITPSTDEANGDVETALTNDNDDDNSTSLVQPLVDHNNNEEAEAGVTEANESTKIICGCMSQNRMIAICSAGSDILCSFAGGISFRYFAVFFLKDLYFGPVLVQVLDALSCLMGTGALVAAQKASVLFGRCPVAVACKAAGVGCLSTMVFCYSYLPRIFTTHLAICILYVLQNVFLNSTQALTRSLIMDNVPSGERAKWSALESINIFGWCGSAAVGGLIVKAFHGNVLPVFIVTASLQVVGSLPLVALFGIEEKEQEQEEQPSHS